MPDIEDEKLADLCSVTSGVAAGAAKWFEVNREVVGAQARAIQRELDSHEELAQQYERAARRPMCVGVFGESQSGKSYLISAMARRGTNPVVARFGDKRLNFLKDINPESGGEATGLVTRFTIRPSAAPATHPVAVRLLSQTDIIKILANAYLKDFVLAVERPPEKSRIEQAFVAARDAVKRGASVTDGLSERQIRNLRRYFEQEAANRATQNALEQSGYWTELEELAPRLPIEERVKLYEFLWGGVETLTRVYLQLYRALDRLGFSAEAFCALDALQPRENSIINVEALKGLLQPAGSTVEIVGQNGRRAHLDRAELTAIISELVINLDEKPADYFDHTDLLDFPGLRSRLDIPIAPELYLREKGAMGMQELFLRGKVAYLFDRYCAERELTSMLLCVQPGNQETRVLPAMVLKWIHASHGDKPADRARVDTALFLVLTKFDKRFPDTAGRVEDTDSLWSQGITAALLDFFGKDKDNWPAEWRPNEPFGNVFWLRNPGFKNRDLMSYADDGSETGVRDPRRILKTKQEYLANALVRRHVANAEQAWEAAFALNDGGISWLANALSPVCRPELKRRQIATLHGDLRARIAQRIDEFYVSDDGGKEAEKRNRAAVEAVRNLVKVAGRQRFGHFLTHLQIGAERLQYEFHWSEMKGNSQGASPPGASFSEKTLLEQLGIDDEPAEASDGPLRSDRSAHLAILAFEHWANRLRELIQEERKVEALGLDAPALKTITHELLAASERLRLVDRLAQDIRGLIQAVETGPAAMLKPAMAAAELINRFVCRLGQDDLATADRAQIQLSKDWRVPVFEARPRLDAMTDLPKGDPVIDRPEIRDWLASFRHVVATNAHGGTSQRNREQNQKLGEIRVRLQA